MSAVSGVVEITPGRVMNPGEKLSISKLNDLGNPTARVAPGTITSRELAEEVKEGLSAPAADSIETFMLKDLSVAEEKLADNAVTPSKCAPSLSVDVRDGWLFVS